jgi:hypothetical protein
VDFEIRLLKVPNDPLGEFLPGSVGRVLLEQPTQQIATPQDREAD